MKSAPPAAALTPPRKINAPLFSLLKFHTCKKNGTQKRAILLCIRKTVMLIRTPFYMKSLLSAFADGKLFCGGTRDSHLSHRHFYPMVKQERGLKHILTGRHSLFTLKNGHSVNAYPIIHLSSSLHFSANTILSPLKQLNKAVQIISCFLFLFQSFHSKMSPNPM